MATQTHAYTNIHMLIENASNNNWTQQKSRNSHKKYVKINIYSFIYSQIQCIHTYVDV